jgi:hypothetical protein
MNFCKRKETNVAVPCDWIAVKEAKRLLKHSNSQRAYYKRIKPTKQSARTCKACGELLTGRQTHWCSRKCHDRGNRARKWDEDALVLMTISKFLQRSLKHSLAESFFDKLPALIDISETLKAFLPIHSARQRAAFIQSFQWVHAYYGPELAELKCPELAKLKSIFTDKRKKRRRRPSTKPARLNK